MKCYGNFGVQKETGLMQVLNDSICGSIAGGTEEIHRNVIFANMLREQIKKEKPEARDQTPRFIRHSMKSVGGHQTA